MYQNTPPRINTGMNVGEAQVFRPDNPDLSQIGYAVGYNSKGAKNNRANKKADKEIAKLDELKVGELPPSWAMAVQEEIKAIREKYYNIDIVNNPNVLQEMDRDLMNLKSGVEQALFFTENARPLNSNIKKDDKFLWKNADRLNAAMTDINYGVDPDTGERPPLSKLNAIGFADYEEVQKENIYDWTEKVEGGALNKNTTGYDKQGDKYTKSEFTVTPESLEASKKKYATIIKGGILGKSGHGIALFEQVKAGFDETDEAKAMVEGSEEYNNALIEFGFENVWKPEFIAKSKQRSESRFIDGEPKEDKDKGDDKFDQSLYTITTETIPNEYETTSQGAVPAGQTTYSVSNIPDFDLVVDIGEGESKTQSEAKAFKARYSPDGTKEIIVKVPTKSKSYDKSVIEKAVPYEQIKGQLNKKELAFMEERFRMMDKEPKVEGFSQKELQTIKDEVDVLKDGWSNKTPKAKDVAKLLFGDDYTEKESSRVKNVTDPTGTDDLSFELDGEPYSFQLNEEGEIKFAEFIAKNRKESKSKELPVVVTEEDYNKLKAGEKYMYNGEEFVKEG